MFSHSLLQFPNLHLMQSAARSRSATLPEHHSSRTVTSPSRAASHSFAGREHPCAETEHINSTRSASDLMRESSRAANSFAFDTEDINSARSASHPMHGSARTARTSSNYYWAQSQQYLGVFGSFNQSLRISTSRITMRSSSALDRDSPIDLMRSRNSFDCPNPPWDPIASSRPIVFSCSIY